jgi:hypothetical protein
VLLAEFQRLNEQKAAASARFVQAQLTGNTVLVNQMDDVVARVSFFVYVKCVHTSCANTPWKQNGY